MRITGAQAIVRCLENADISHVFGVPGEQNLAIVDALYDSHSVDFISTRHEGGASFMAEAYGKATGNPAVCLATAGVGASNLTLGTFTALQDSTPMIVLIGQVNSQFRGREAWQEIDLDFFYSHITKWSVEIKEVSRIPEILHQAISISKAGRPGPVVISVPEDILSELAEFAFYPSLSLKKPSITEVEAIEIMHLLHQAKRPVILAGGGVSLSQAQDELLRFSELSGIPVMTAFRRHDVFPNDHPLYLGNSGLGTFPEYVQTLKEADLILAIGTRMSEISTQKYTIPTKEQKVIHIDIDANVLTKQPFTAEVSLLSDVKNALTVLLRCWKESTNTIEVQQWSYNQKNRVEKALAQRKKERQRLFTDGVSFKNTISIEKIVEDLQEVLPKDSTITSDAGNFFTWFANYYKFTAHGRYLGPTSGAMGYGLPSAISAKLAYPDRPAIALCGDGGLMMTIQEFETAIRYHIPIITLVFNNNSYGAIRLHQERRFPKRTMGSALQNPPFDELAKLFGGNGYKISNNGEFKSVLIHALQQNKPTIIEIPMDIRMISAGRVLDQETLQV